MQGYLVRVLRFLGSDSLALGIVSICSVLSFAISIVVSHRTARISKVIKYNSTIDGYNKKKQVYQKIFEGHRMSIQVDEIHTDRLLKDILKNTDEFDWLFHKVIDFPTRVLIWKLKIALRKEAKRADFNRICNCLAALSARLSERKDRLNG